MLAVHTMRRGWNAERTALINRTRGLLAEFGIWLGRSTSRLERALPELIDSEAAPPRVRLLLRQARTQLAALDQQIGDCDRQIDEHAKHSDAAQRLQAVAGIGPVTSSAIVATVAHATDFKNGRQVAAWLGLVPRQSSSGGKERLGKITKRGDTYLRGLLTQGARSSLQSALRRAPEKRSRLQSWIVAVHDRIGYHKTLIAIANKHARILWAILAHGDQYNPDAWKRYASAAG